MAAVKYCILTTLILLYSATKATANYKAHFPLSNKTNFPRLVVGALPNLNEFTICSWIRPLRLNVQFPHIFTYTTKDYHDDISVFLYVKTEHILIYLQLKNRAQYFGFNCSSIDWKVGDWQHICTSWFGADGSIKMFGNGKKCDISGSERLYPNEYVAGGGVAVIGQEQDVVGSNFDASQAWYGDITSFNLWSYVLNEEQAKGIAECNGNFKEGDVIAWSKTPMGVYDGIVITDSDFC